MKMTNKNTKANLEQKRKSISTLEFHVFFYGLTALTIIGAPSLLFYEIYSDIQYRSQTRRLSEQLEPFIDSNGDGRVDFSERLELYRKMGLPEEKLPKDETEKPKIYANELNGLLEKALHNYQNSIK